MTRFKPTRIGNNLKSVLLRNQQGHHVITTSQHHNSTFEESGNNNSLRSSSNLSNNFRLCWYSPLNHPATVKFVTIRTQKINLNSMCQMPNQEQTFYTPIQAPKNITSRDKETKGLSSTKHYLNFRGPQILNIFPDWMRNSVFCVD